ncbi:MAG: class I SAM-dependent methyltransferase [Thermoleophilaceae bacterium]
MQNEERAPGAYAAQSHDSMRAALETGFFAELLPDLLRAAGGEGALLDLGCSDGLAARLAGSELRRYTGVDLREPAGGVPGEMVEHDLCDGLGPVGAAPFDVYLATFGFASHLSPAELGRLLEEIVAHARPGSLVALEALGLHSLEWPRIWETEPGPGRVLSYRLGAPVPVHPWGPLELGAIYEQAGIRVLRTLDRTVQAGPKVGEGGYWPGLPPLRDAMNRLLEGDSRPTALADALPPLPAGPAAALHHELAGRRRRMLTASAGRTGPAALARAVWALEPRSGGGFGHGLTVIGRVP